MYIIAVSVGVKHHESFETGQRLPESETRKFTDLFLFFTPSPVSSSLICAILQSDRTVTKCVHFRIFLLSFSQCHQRQEEGEGGGGRGGGGEGETHRFCSVMISSPRILHIAQTHSLSFRKVSYNISYQVL